MYIFSACSSSYNRIFLKLFLPLNISINEQRSIIMEKWQRKTFKILSYRLYTTFIVKKSKNGKLSVRNDTNYVTGIKTIIRYIH